MFAAISKQSLFRGAAILASLLALVAGIPSLSGQTAGPGETVAAEEAVRREAAKLLLRDKLQQAQAAQKSGELRGASKLYDEAYALVQKIGVVGIESETQQTIAGLTEVQLKLAKDAEKRNDTLEAQQRVNRILAVDPKNQETLAYKKVLDKKVEMLRGKLPSQEMQTRIPELGEKAIKSGTLVQDAKVLMESGRFDEAEKKLTQAIQEDSQNQSAFYYMSVVKEQRYNYEVRKRGVTTKEKLVEVEKAWTPPSKGLLLPEANPFARTNLIHTGPGRQVLYSKLDKIILDEVKFPEGLPLNAVIAFLDEQVRLRDPDKKGINFVISSHADKFIPVQQQSTQTDPNTGLPLPAPAPIEPIKDLGNDVTVRINPPLRQVPLGFVLEIITKVAQAPSSPYFQGIKYSIEEHGIIFSQRFVDPQNPQPVQLYTRFFRVDPNTFLQGLEGVSVINPVPSTSSSTGGGGGLGGGGLGGGGLGGGGLGGGGLGGGGLGGGGGGATGGEIPRVFVAGSGGYGGLGGGGGFGGGGLGGGGGGFGGGGLGGGGLGGGGLGGGGLGGGGGYGGGGGLTGVTRITLMSEVQNIVRQFFTEATGVNFGGSIGGGQGGQFGGQFGNQGGQFGGQFGNQGNQGGLGTGQGGSPQSVIRPMFFNDRTGILFVRATLEELDLIDQAIQALNFAPPQVNLEAKFVEITQSDNKALGFDWFVGPMSTSNGKIFMQGGSAPQLASPASSPPYYPIGTGPGSIAPSQTDGLLTSGLRNQAPALGTITGILTDPQFRLVIHALEQREGVEVMVAPNVTTISGRQAQIQSTVMRQILAGVSATTSQPGTTTATTGVGTVNQAAPVPILQPIPVGMPTGPTLDVIPYVSADGYTIQMTLIPSVLDFLGYGNPDIPEAKAFEDSIQAQTGNIKSPIPLPRFLIRQVTTSATVWDGQTVVLGGLIAEDLRRQKDKVPILGDIPLLGRLFRSETSGSTKKNLVVFVSAKIVDPAGNRVHTEDNLPYDPSTIPMQRPVPQVTK